MGIIMNIKLIPEKISSTTASEEELLDLSKIESIYEIRALRAAIDLEGFEIEVTKTNDRGQVYIDSHEIWLKPGTWLEIT